jgi:hypothetical protein
MDTKPDNSKYWQELISWKFWLHTVIVDAVLAGIWFVINKLITIQPIIRDIGFLLLLIAGLFAVAWYLPKFATKRQMDNSTQAKIKADPASNKLTLVIKAIEEAKLVTPKDKKITVYISYANKLAQIYPEELKTILLKLQGDEKILKLISFPDWLLSSGKYTQKKISQHILATIEPSRNKFMVRTFKKFEKFSKL